MTGYSSRTAVNLAVAICLFALCGCKPPGFYYSAPTVSPAQTATITGSKTDNLEILINAIDGAYTSEAGLPKWDDALVLASGSHTVSATVTRGPALGFGEVRLNAQPGKAYVLRGTPPAVMGPSCVQFTIWIEDEHNLVVTDKVAVEVLNGTPSSEVPLPGGGFIVVPGRPSTSHCAPK